ncbi:hypothetical protein [Streptosporangium sp. KLBMP 9127]|nr:hypothetical protein [Streptosporangium sp. KLBMP 9127]
MEVGDGQQLHITGVTVTEPDHGRLVNVTSGDVYAGFELLGLRLGTR